MQTELEAHLLKRRKDVTLEAVNEFYCHKGYTIPKIAAQLHCSRHAIQHRLNLLGIKDRRPRYWHKYTLDKAEIIKLYRDEKLSTIQIGRLYSVSPGNITEILKRAEIPRRSLTEAAEIRCQRQGRPYNYKNGRHRSAAGYIYILQPGGKYVPEHRVIWEQAYGPLPTGYVVHHLNGIKDDNRLENLAALPRAIHLKDSARGPKGPGDPLIKELHKRIRELETKLKQKSLFEVNNAA